MKGVICGTGACVPERVLDNHKIAEFVDTSDQWIRERTGVLRRHIAEKETTVSMGAEAARQAIKESGISSDEVDLIISSDFHTGSDFSMHCVRDTEETGTLSGGRL